MAVFTAHHAAHRAADTVTATARLGEATVGMPIARRAAHRAAATALPAVTQARLEAVVDQVIGAEVVEGEGRGPEEVAPGVLPVTPVGLGAESQGGAAPAPTLSQRSVVVFLML